MQKQRHCKTNGLLTPPTSPSPRHRDRDGVDQSSLRPSSPLQSPKTHKPTSAILDIHAIPTPMQSPVRVESTLKTPPKSPPRAYSTTPSRTTTTSGHSNSSSENEHPFLPCTPKKRNRPGRFTQILAPPIYACPLDGTFDEDINNRHPPLRVCGVDFCI